MKKILYYGNNRVRFLMIVGSIHLGKLPWDRVPTINEILTVLKSTNHLTPPRGHPLFWGMDDRLNHIYLIDLGKNRALGLQTIRNVLTEYHKVQEWQFFSTLEESNILVKIGGFCLEALHMVTIGNLISALGIQRSYHRLINLVHKIKGVNLVGEA